jgi:hypothetical protein
MAVVDYVLNQVILNNVSNFYRLKGAPTAFKEVNCFLETRGKKGAKTIN